MSSRRFAIGLVCAAMFALAAAAAEPPAGGMPELTAEQQAMMERWQAFATPGDPHRVLAAKAGTYVTQVKMWEAAGAPPMESTGTSKLELILDGRYLIETAEGSFQGQPFLGRGLCAYDNMKKKYVCTWIDNMGTGISVSEGSYDAGSKTFTYQTEMPDVMKGKYQPMRIVEKDGGNGRWITEMFTKGPDGKEFRMMEVVYTRKP